MNRGFWDTLPKPFFALAPMAGVTDTVFRQIIASRAKPDIFWTEFVSCDGLCSKGRGALLRDLSYSEVERPIVAQVFGATPKHFFETAKLVADLRFDGIDINMGCPDRAVVGQRAGAALLKNPSLAKEIILATKEGAGALPVSVKTRIGFDDVEIDSWIPALLETGLAALTIHLRTKKELSESPAHWDILPHIVEMRAGTNTLLLGNGDVENLDDARRKLEETGADGIMLGRAIFGNPWLFDASGKISTVPEKLEALLLHMELFENTWKGMKPFELMKKHAKAYVNGFSGASKLRAKLMECERAFEAKEIIARFVSTLSNLEG